MAEIIEPWDFKPSREYEVAGKITAIVEKQDNEGWMRERTETSTVYLDVATGLIVGNRETFEAFIAPLDALVMPDDGTSDWL